MKSTLTDSIMSAENALVGWAKGGQLFVRGPWPLAALQSHHCLEFVKQHCANFQRVQTASTVYIGLKGCL